MSGTPRLERQGLWLKGLKGGRKTPIWTTTLYRHQLVVQGHHLDMVGGFNGLLEPPNDLSLSNDTCKDREANVMPYFLQLNPTTQLSSVLKARLRETFRIPDL